MQRHRLAVLATLLVVVAAPVRGQRGMGAMGGMMGMHGDPATMSRMSVIHELIVNHDRIRRTVTNLPDGIRTVTESDDPAIAAGIKTHVVTMNQTVVDQKDPALPMESAALRTIYQYADRIQTRVDTTAKGVILVQTSTVPAAVTALQTHAAEVSALVDGGMEALHRSMMKMMSGGDFAAMQMRGEKAMGVDQYTSTHKFDALPDGGRIELQRDVDDTVGVAEIRKHLQDIARAFKAGDFSTPGFVHMQNVPGTDVMAAKRDQITYQYGELPRGGEVRIITSDAKAIEAIHRFLEFQRTEHRTGG